MPKPIVQIRNAIITPAINVWPCGLGLNPDDMVLCGDLVSKHPVLGGV